ncbi:MAG: VCBS repeat-containing protein [Planctomycetes bacterium]|nr:VCBS repeat-containing protein [Planctomycetota bacterium]
MRVRPLSLTLAVLTATLGLTACGGGGKKRSSSNSTAAPVQSAGTTAPTSGTLPTVPSGQIGGGISNPAGGNTSSGSANTGATAGGYQGGTGVFVDASNLLPNSTDRDWGAEAGDFDGDGRIDIAIVVNQGASRILFNNGAAGFSERAGHFPNLSMAASDVRAVDIDGDGDLDLIFSANFEPVRVFKNDGTGRFTLFQEFDLNNDAYTYKLVLGDANGDGHQDVFLARAGQNTPSRGQNKLFLNDGTGTFTEAPAGSIPPKFDDSLNATFLDVNGDGHVDIIVANFGTPHTVLINNGTGRFVDQSDVWLPPGLTRYGTAIAQGDMNRDGKIDLFICNEGTGSPPPGEKNSLLLQSVGRFIDDPAAVPSDDEASFAVRLIDVDGDGWLDVVVSNLRAVQRLYMNRNGVLVDATANFPAVNNVPANSRGLTIGDFNGDLAPDILFVRSGAKPMLFLNTR